MDDTDIRNFIIAGCILMILTLPGPYLITRCCRARVVRVVVDEAGQPVESKEPL